MSIDDNKNVEKKYKNVIAVVKKYISKKRKFNVGNFSNFDKTSIFLLLENIGNGIIIRFSFLKNELKKILKRKGGESWKVNFMKRTSY